MKTTLTQEEYNNILAASLLEARTIPNYRLGQAIYNNLPYQVADTIVTTEYDMFHVKDTEKVMILFDRLIEK